MKTNRLYLGIIGLLSACSLASCHHDKSGTAQRYRIAKEYLYDGNGVVSDSVFYTYTSNGQIAQVKVQGADPAFYSFQYTGPLISKRTQYADAAYTSEVGYNEITYNGDGTVNKIDYYEKTGTTYIKTKTTAFDYSNGKFVKATFSVITNGTPVTIHTYDYTYTNNDIATVVSKDYSTGTPVAESLTFTFDNNANYFKKFNQPLLSDAVFFEEISEADIPVLFSYNNISSFTLLTIPIGLTYSLDNNENLVQVKTNNVPSVAYSYEQY